MDNHRKYALVTGASSGIGWHISEELARRGYNIIAVSNQPEQLDNLKKRLEHSYHVNTITLSIDLGLEDSARKVFDFCAGDNLIVEILVNNAGILVFGEIIEVDFSRMESILRLHVTTTALLCRLFGEQMVRLKKGLILNVSSITAVMPYPGVSLYGPTKAFLRLFTRALRTEMKLYGINVTCLLPGATVTALYNTNSFNTPLLLRFGVMKKPETVAKAGVNALFNNRAECIPGFLNKLIVLLLPVVPNFIIGFIYKRTDLVRYTNSIT